jgi:hypothetical protein
MGKCQFNAKLLGPGCKSSNAAHALVPVSAVRKPVSDVCRAVRAENVAPQGRRVVAAHSLFADGDYYKHVAVD